MPQAGGSGTRPYDIFGSLSLMVWVGEALGPPAVNRPCPVGSAKPGAALEMHHLKFSSKPAPSGAGEIA